MVSVIIPTYNRANLIQEALDSVLSQTYPRVEIIIIDDGSTDNTKEIVHSYSDHRIQYIQQENSGLPANARNKGLRVAQGEFIAFLDSDDIWLPKKLAIQVDFLQKNSAVVAIGSNAITFPEKSSIFLPLKRDRYLSFHAMLRGNWIINSSLVIRKKIMMEIGFQDENPAVKASEDYDYCLRILHRYDHAVFIVKTPLVLYRIFSGNLSEISMEYAPFSEIERFKVIMKKYPELSARSTNHLLKNRESFALSKYVYQKVLQQQYSVRHFLFHPHILLKHKMKVVFFKKTPPI